MMSPTSSPGLAPVWGLEPTRLLVAETTPVIPVVPLPQVAAPRSLFQLGLPTTKLPFCNAVMMSPTSSPGLAPAWRLEPTRLLVAETTPVIPVVPLPQVAAPRSLFQLGLPTTKLPFCRAKTQSPTRSPALEPTRLLVWETTPEMPVVPLLQVAAPCMP